eukprot:1423616-Alexandrium_andersonii.AAC.1
MAGPRPRGPGCRRLIAPREARDACDVAASSASVHIRLCSWAVAGLGGWAPTESTKEACIPFLCANVAW